jgi:hypothetical protein
MTWDGIVPENAASARIIEKAGGCSRGHPGDGHRTRAPTLDLLVSWLVRQSRVHRPIVPGPPLNGPVMSAVIQPP